MFAAKLPSNHGFLDTDGCLCFALLHDCHAHAVANKRVASCSQHPVFALLPIYQRQVALMGARYIIGVGGKGGGMSPFP